jgi:hypothetical protein
VATNCKIVRGHPRQSGTYPQLTAEELDHIVQQLVDADSDGVILQMAAIVARRAGQQRPAGVADHVASPW